MTAMLIHNIRIALPNGQLMTGEVLMDNGKIIQISDQPIDAWSGARFDGQGNMALPGFIDLHIHGAMGADFMDGDEQAFATIARYLPQEGTTSFLATTLTQSVKNIQRAVDSGKRFMSEEIAKSANGAEMLGFHLEGPFIHPDQAGAQPLEFIREPSMHLVQGWFGNELDHLKVVTLAPETDDGFTVIQYLTEHGVISSAGHTTATYAQIEQATQYGLRHLTHFCNAMTGLHHREIGVVGAGLLNNQLVCEVIADGIHISDDMLKLMLKVIGPERLVLITDSMRAKGLTDGTYTLADQQVEVVGAKATLANGTLAGSVLKMNDGVKKIQELADVSLHDIMKMTSSNAAQRLGVYERKGSIEVGKDADIVLLNDKFDVHSTFCMGRMSYARDHF
ncbi:N-acetylglucosamine-6-phosphate deacetylase [Paenisporosarcina quisquiliarum]|uniref:N-acetylglucosamine-6-phosphate deacetylase n=1 Tax=Paenisporosarcina quisquiliarum TaxID=365346 RepID=A0A9X3LH93_9BACL|nr:N-acetylglucosamine-6-phosphate deacetylase [Paenisporosarcina quisquiliarum]MCZ8537370.1 N-acetylglucosamine-6-phosphate deacetylase [Paenisporosarcina quisquiliarum]